MNHFFIATLVFLTVSLTHNACTTRPTKFNLSGNWASSTATSEFNLSLHQKSKSISGNHCSVMQSGNRIDCSDDEEQSINGAIENGSDIATVTFNSFYTNTTGKATIRLLSDTTMEWKIIEKPAGDFYIPAKAVLKKIRSTAVDTAKGPFQNEGD